MDWLQFFASVISALAWPGLIVFLVLTAKGPLIALLPRLKMLKLPNFEVHLDNAEELLADSSTATKEVTSPGDSAEVRELPPPAPTPPDMSAPHDFIRSQWRAVESALRGVARRYGWPEKDNNALMDFMVDHDLFPRPLRVAIAELERAYKLSELYDHPTSLSRSDALRFWEASKGAIAQLDALRPWRFRFYDPDKAKRAGVSSEATKMLTKYLTHGSHDSEEPPFMSVTAPPDTTEQEIELVRRFAAARDVRVEVDQVS